MACFAEYTQPIFMLEFIIYKLMKYWKTTILRKTIEGYLDLFPSLTFNTIKIKLIMHVFYSSRYLQPK